MVYFNYYLFVISKKKMSERKKRKKYKYIGEPVKVERNVITILLYSSTSDSYVRE